MLYCRRITHETSKLYYAISWVWYLNIKMWDIFWVYSIVILPSTLQSTVWTIPSGSRSSGNWRHGYAFPTISGYLLQGKCNYIKFILLSRAPDFLFLMRSPIDISKLHIQEKERQTDRQKHRVREDKTRQDKKKQIEGIDIDRNRKTQWVVFCGSVVNFHPFSFCGDRDGMDDEKRKAKEGIREASTWDPTKNLELCTYFTHLKRPRQMSLSF